MCHWAESNNKYKFTPVRHFSVITVSISSVCRMCHTLCGYAGMKMMKAIFDYDEALAIYKLNNVKFYVDGLREVDGDSFYDSEGTLVWSPTMGLNNTINEENTRMTGLTSNWGDVGDIWSEIEYFGKDVKICLCIHK